MSERDLAIEAGVAELADLEKMDESLLDLVAGGAYPEWDPTV